MNLLRSEKMGYYTMVMPREYAWEVLSDLGELSALQFVDLNADEAPFSKPYANYIRRCDEMENKINVIENEMQRFNKTIIRCENIDYFLQNLKKMLTEKRKSERAYFEEVENQLGDKLKNLLEQVRIRDTLIEKFDHLVEYRQVLLRAYSLVSGTGEAVQDLSLNLGNDMRGEEESKTNYHGQENIRFTYLAGVINKEDALRFKRILFRVTRGMVWTTIIDIERVKTSTDKADFDHLMDTTSEQKQKCVFLIVYQGGSHEMMAGKLNKICDSFGASKYGLPADRQTYDRKLIEVEAQLREAKSVIAVTEKHIHVVLDYFSSPRGHDMHYSLLDELKMFILKEKVIYTNLNKLKLQNTLYKGNCWCPLKIVPQVYDTINKLKRRGSEIGGCEFQECARPHDSKPPTYFRTNDVTWIFQEIVNTYGIPRYREINPALFAIATFPFLFGVMFGDIGHGAMIFAAGIYLCWFKSSIENDKTTIWRTLLPGRYLLLFQGFFATYCGLIYNDFMAIPFNIFGSCYEKVSEEEITGPKPDCTYPVGIDPLWYGTSNELTYINSFKMKLSIIFGVVQMLFGILLRGFNAIHFRNWLDFCFEFLPMFIFLSLTFGYMVVLIFLKWSISWGTEEYPTHDAPSIIAIFIKMALNPGEWVDGNGLPLYGDREGSLQASIQAVFLVVALICGILILFPKPLILLYRHKKATQYNLVAHEHERTINRNLLHHDLDPIHHLDEEHKEDSGNKLLERSLSNSSHSLPQLELEHFEFSEVFVHQIIEAIEFILGSISNTASYLRLWALSLAHSQLAKVFYDNALESFIENGNVVGLFVGFLVFANATFGILLLMDQMECFLHALRLHWVEFQNKFYRADGYLFVPFSFKKSITQAKGL